MSKSLLCPIPWMSTAIRNNGHYRVCCHANTSKDQGLFWGPEKRPFLAGEHNVSTTRNHPALKNIRKKMLQGEWPSSCQRCEIEERCEITSKRQHEWEIWKKEITPEKILEKTAVDGKIDENDFPVLSLDLRLGNLCNLKCRMCGPTDSHSWHKEFGRLHSVEEFTDTHGKVSLRKSKGNSSLKAYEWYESEDFWKDLETISPRLKHIYFVGGEPLLIKKHFEYLKNLITADLAQNIEIEYNTNLTHLSEAVLDLWSHFKKVKLGISLDGIGPVNDYIRYPSIFSKVEKNLRFFDDKNLSNLSARISMTIQNYNIFELRRMIEWLADSNFNFIRRRPHSPLVTTHVLHHPIQFNIQTLLPSLKKKATAEIEHLIEDLKSKYFAEKFGEPCRKKTITRLLGIINYMNSEDLSMHYEEFLTYTHKLDLLRKQNFAHVVPEFFQEDQI